MSVRLVTAHLMASTALLLTPASAARAQTKAAGTPSVNGSPIGQRVLHGTLQGKSTPGRRLETRIENRLQTRLDKRIDAETLTRPDAPAAIRLKTDELRRTPSIGASAGR